MLLMAKLAKRQDSGFGGGRHLELFVCCLVCAVGVIFPGWYWYRINRKIASIAAQLENKKELITDNNYTAAVIGTDDICLV